MGHPFDTIKVRLQTSPRTHFAGPLDCVRQTLAREGVRGLYKGATPPLVGWMFMDSVMLGSLTFYRRLLHENVFNGSSPWLPFVAAVDRLPPGPASVPDGKLPTLGHAVAGVMAGCTVSLIAAPVEHVKARLQIQYAADKRLRLYSGPIDCTRKIVRSFHASSTATLLTFPLVPYTWHIRPIPRPLRNAALPLLLLLLVGFLRRPDPLFHHPYLPLHPRRQLLGRRPVCTGLLADELSVGRGEAADHDGSVGWGAGRWRAEVPAVEGRRWRCVEEGWDEGVLEGIPAVFLEGFSRECDGAGGV